MIDSATILVADDSLDDVELLRKAMEKAGVHNPLWSVQDGAEAIEYLKGGDARAGVTSPLPLLMFLDLEMPRCTGFAVLDWMRRQSHLQNLPTIIFSSSDQPGDIEQSLRLGAHGYWVKPTRFEDLVKLASRLKAVLTRVADRVDQDQLAIPA